MKILVWFGKIRGNRSEIFPIEFSPFRTTITFTFRASKATTVSFQVSTDNSRLRQALCDRGENKSQTDGGEISMKYCAWVANTWYRLGLWRRWAPGRNTDAFSPYSFFSYFLVTSQRQWPSRPSRKSVFELFFSGIHFSSRELPSSMIDASVCSPNPFPLKSTPSWTQ